MTNSTNCYNPEVRKLFASIMGVGYMILIHKNICGVSKWLGLGLDDAKLQTNMLITGRLLEIVEKGRRRNV